MSIKRFMFKLEEHPFDELLGGCLPCGVIHYSGVNMFGVKHDSMVYNKQYTIFAFHPESKSLSMADHIHRSV